MLEYLDRAPSEVPLPPRLALTTIRLWATEVRRDRCPVMLLRDLLRRFGAAGALWPAHNFTYWVVAHAARPISLGCPCCGRISEDEALLLAAIFADRAETAQAALRDLVTPQALVGAARLTRGLGVDLRALHRFDA